MIFQHLYFVALSLLLNVLDTFAAPDEYATVGHNKKQMKLYSLQSYLLKYGYLPPTSDTATIPESEIREALSAFKSEVGLGKDSIIDKKTLNLMRQPRCGMSDKSH